MMLSDAPLFPELPTLSLEKNFQMPYSQGFNFELVGMDSENKIFTSSEDITQLY